MEIKREKYTIRPWRISDAVDLAVYADDIKIWNNIRDYFPHPYTEKDGETFIALVMKKENPEDFVIEVDGRSVGGIGIVPQNDVERFNAEIGYWLNPRYWGRGIMTDVVRDVVNYVWENTSVIRLFAPVFAYNIGSRRVLEKAGFRFVGLLEKAAFKNSVFVDMAYYEIVKKD